MTDRTLCRGLDASDPLGFLAALGLLRVISRVDPSSRLRWVQDGLWYAALETSKALDLAAEIMTDVERWRGGHPALDVAAREGAGRKEQDLKHPPGDFRQLMRDIVHDPEAADFVAAYATGVAVDGSGQTKPTSLHFTAGQQRFLASILDVLGAVNLDDITEALDGPWNGRVGPSDTRWRAGSERSRALLAYDPSGQKSATVVGAVWLAFQGMPLMPTAPVGSRIITTGFTGRGKKELLTWPVWTPSLTIDQVRVLLGIPKLEEMDRGSRTARGIATVYRARVTRSAQGYGNFAAPEPV